LVFAGWIKDPSCWMEFEVFFTKQPMPTDPLEIKLLATQEKQLAEAGIEGKSVSSPPKKTDTDAIDDNWIEEKKSSAKSNLKAPPLYSSETKGRSKFKESVGDVDKGPETSVVKTSAHTSVKAKADDSIDTVFVMTGTQIDNGIDDRKISFRGSYRCQSKASVERLNLICSIHASSPVATTGASSSACAVAASANKRNRSDDGEDSVEANSGVAYQELIDLHDDSRLTTEDLKRKYYGRGSGDMAGDGEKKRPAESKRLKGNN